MMRPRPTGGAHNSGAKQQAQTAKSLANREITTSWNLPPVWSHRPATLQPPVPHPHSTATLQVGFEVRVRLNVRKRYLLAELALENIEAELKGKYDAVLCYFCGRGDGDSFLTQYNEIVTVREVWDLLDEVGFKGKPRMMVMDLFDVRSTYMEDELEVLKKLEFDVSEARADVELMVFKVRDG